MPNSYRENERGWRDDARAGEDPAEEWYYRYGDSSRTGARFARVGGARRMDLAFAYGHGRGDPGPSAHDRMEQAHSSGSAFGYESPDLAREMDEADDGSADRVTYRGRGPRGYRRSDVRIAEEVIDRLTDDDFLDASGISVNVTDHEVTLDGTVDSGWAKRRAEDCAEIVLGVTHVQNNLRVRHAADREPPPS